MKIVTVAEMREIDRVTSATFGVPSLTLMENAGTAVANVILQRYPNAKRVGIICGKGNNGGDGLVVARKLREAGREVLLLLLSDPAALTGDPAQQYSRLPVKALAVTDSATLAASAAQAVFQCDVLVDAILGAGFHPPVQGLFAEAITALNQSSAPVVAVDVPSGIDGDSFAASTSLAARADAVVTFTAPKPAHAFLRLCAGPTVIAPIGSPPAAIASTQRLNLVTPRDISALLGPRDAAANKGNFGHVLVVGGSLGKAGAAAMAGMSALRAGAGLSSIATPKSVLATVAGFHPECMTEQLEETDVGTASLRALEYGRMDHIVHGKTVLAIGPGISRHSETAEFVRTVVSRYSVPTVLDADGLNAFEGQNALLSGSSRALVLTPHPGEMARLAQTTTAAVQADRVGVARAFARDHQAIVILKGHRTLVALPNEEIWVNPTGNPGMATGGTGDILTGLVAGLIAQHPHRVADAAIAAVFLHGLAGDIACETMGELSLVATDLVKTLPEAFRRARQAAGADLVAFGETPGSGGIL